jgi:hypothetical protein
VPHSISVSLSCSLSISANASLLVMDAAFESSTIVVDGILKIVNFLAPMSKFISNYMFTSEDACKNNQPALFTSGHITGSGYIAMIKKNVLFASSTAPLVWTGPTMVLKYASTLEYARAVSLDADIIFENAIIKSCALLPAVVSTSRSIFVRDISLAPHEIPYEVDLFYSLFNSKLFKQRATALVVPFSACSAPITFKAR